MAETTDPGTGKFRPDIADGERDRAIDMPFTMALEEKPIWSALYEGIRDALFAPKLPPLELTSTPVPVEDRMAARTNPWAVGTSTALNAGIVTALLCMGLGAAFRNGPKPVPGPNVDLSDMHFFAPVKTSDAHGGSSDGGGSHDRIAPIEGRPPHFEKTPLLQPQIPLLEHPKLAVEPAVAVDIRLPDNQAMPNIGVHASPNVQLASNGPGSSAGIGTGTNGGVGPGQDRGYGDQIYAVGVGGVTAPIALFTPEAEFSDEARRQKYEGMCIVAVIVDAHGMPQNPRVMRHLGMGLDEKAIDAVMRYRFKPATKNGKPVPVAITVLVNFHLLL